MRRLTLYSAQKTAAFGLTLGAALACAGCAGPSNSGASATSTTSSSSSTPASAPLPSATRSAGSSLTSAPTDPGPADTPTGTVSRPADPVAPTTSKPVQRGGAIPTPTDPGPADTPTGTVSRPADPVAPTTSKPVQRGGAIPTPTVSAKSGSFAPTSPVTYPDGVKLVVTDVKQAVESGKGPGMFPGRPLTEIGLTLTNQGTSPIELNHVVVTTTYGSPALLASPVYNDPAARDFSGTVAPGANTTATYVFSVPTAQMGIVTTVVDFDGVHVAGIFTGTAK